LVHCPPPRPSLPHRILVPPDCPAQARGIARVILLLHCLPFGHQVRPCTPATSASRWRPRSPCTFQLRAPGGSGLWRRVCCRCAAVQCLPFALEVPSPSHTTFSSLSRAALCARCCRLAPLAAPPDGAHSSTFSLVCPTLRPFIPHVPPPDLLGVMFEAFSEFAARRSCHSMHTTFLFSPFSTLHVPRAVPRGGAA